MLRSFSLVLLPVILIAGGCHLDDVACTANIQPGIIVTILDSVTGEPRAEEAVGTAETGAFLDPLRPYGFDGQPSVMVSRHAAEERPGTYTVTIHEVGYQDWQRPGVNVVQGRCHVQTVELDARLQPAP